MTTTLGFLCDEPTASEPELAELEKLFSTIVKLLSESIDSLRKTGSHAHIQLQLAMRLSNPVEAELLRRNIAKGHNLRCFLVQPLTADHPQVELPSSAASPDLAAELLVDRADVLVIAARTAEQAEAAVHRLLNRAGDRRPEVVGICIDNPRILGVYDLADARLQVRQIEQLRLAIASFAEQSRATLPVAAQESPWEPGWTIGGLYPLLFQFNTSQFKIRDFQEKSVQEMPWPRDARVLFGDEFAKLEAIRGEIVSAFTTADQLGIYYGNLFRTLCLLILGLHLSAVTIALVFSVSPPARALPYIEAIALSIALTLYWWGHARKVLRKWIDYRLLAELLRPTPYFLALGHFFHPRAPDISPESLDHWHAVVRKYRDIISSVNCPPIVFTGQYLYGAVHVLRSYIEGQVRWHRGFERQHESIHRRLVWFGGIAFAVVFVTAFAHAITSIAIKNAQHLPVTGNGGESLEESALRHILLGVAIIVPMVGFAISIVLHQLGFEQVAERSAGAADRLQAILQSIDGHHGPVLATHLHHWATQCEQAVAEEQSSWYRQTARIGFHL